MAKNRGWSTPPSMFTGVVEEQLSQRVRVIAMAMLNEIVLRSPVDTGRFRGNNIVSVGAPVYTSINSVDKNGNETIQRGLSVMSGLEPFTQVFIQNNLHMQSVSRTATPSRLRMAYSAWPSPAWQRRIRHDLRADSAGYSGPNGVVHRYRAGENSLSERSDSFNKPRHLWRVQAARNRPLVPAAYRPRYGLHGRHGGPPAYP